MLVDKTNPFGNCHLLPRGVLREPIRNLKRADFIFITKSDGNSEELRARIRGLNTTAEIIECRHRPRYLQNVYTSERIPLEWLKGRTVTSLSGIAVPQILQPRRSGCSVYTRLRPSSSASSRAFCSM